MSSKIKSDILLKQYEIAKEEIQKSIFVQYDVIKLGTLFLSTLLVAIPTGYLALGGNNLLFLALVLLSLAFISMSFVFIMGAGEIRIMRAATFCNRIIKDFLKEEDNKNELVWDDFVTKWNKHLYGEDKSWKFQERVYLSMPFTIIAIIADLTTILLIAVWLQSAELHIFEISIVIIVIISLSIHVWMYKRPANLSRELHRASIKLG